MTGQVFLGINILSMTPPALYNIKTMETYLPSDTRDPRIANKWVGVFYCAAGVVLVMIVVWLMMHKQIPFTSLMDRIGGSLILLLTCLFPLMMARIFFLMQPTVRVDIDAQTFIFTNTANVQTRVPFAHILQITTGIASRYSRTQILRNSIVVIYRTANGQKKQIAASELSWVDPRRPGEKITGEILRNRMRCAVNPKIKNLPTS